MKLTPPGERARVQPVECETSTASGIVLPAKVVAVGKFENSNVVSEGDLVLYAKYSGTEIKPDDEDYPFLDADDPLGIVEG